jgi:hypothetical protein
MRWASNIFRNIDFDWQIFDLTKTTPGHQKAARRGGDKNEKEEFYIVGIPGAWTRSAEYPLF